MQKRSIVIIGAGIGGLTAAALLARQGHSVQVFEQAWIPGGCASTFRRQGFTFDVGATQVAGLEPGGIHQRIFEVLETDLPPASPCDPACAVYLPGETHPISVWRDPLQWQRERQEQFPGSERFWALLQTLFQASWRFQSRDPVLPPRNLWDVGQLFQALRPDTLVTVPHTFRVVTDALQAYGLAGDRRLRTFLDLQLKLYSQVDASATALLYAATALSVSQAPQGLFHLEGSMQVLSDRLVEAVKRWGGSIHCGQTVTGILTQHNQVMGVRVQDRKTGTVAIVSADQVVANVTVQNLVQLLGEETLPPTMAGYAQRVQQLPEGSGAFVLYLGVKRSALPPSCPPHLQFLYDYDRPQANAPDPISENNSLFVSVSREGDGRAPADQATLIASSFTDLGQWWQASTDSAQYQALKARYTQTALDRLGRFFDLSPETLVHQEAATPCTFAHFTHRDRGAVGGLSQRLASFGPFGFANRTPVGGLWLVGDCTHPGEGTAGVSYSAWTVARQIEALY
ncbi:MAG: C-3',4' desaturase CrtD [Prochlorotrichaceae cyanobacterium]|jgi:C-3',4' desaturase CrtD